VSTRPTLAPRRALAAAAVVLALGIAGLVGPAGVVAAQETEPAPSTEPVPADDGGTATSTTVAEGGDDTTVEDAQAEADADLRSVWIIVAALGAVAFALLVMLVLYVRATNPARAARRRRDLVARADERRRAKEARRGATATAASDDDDLVSDADEEDDDERTEVVAAVAPAAAAAPASPVVATPPARKPAAVLSRDPDDESEVRVLGASDAAGPTSTEPARPESPSAPVTTGSGAGTRRRAKPLTAPPVGSKVAPAGPPPGPAEGDETVRIVPAPSGPAAVPTSAGAGAVVSTPGAPPAGDRPPPRSLVDSPPPPRRPRRVDAPAKKLGTADAERVLVRPGQTPVRLPPSMTAPGDPAAEESDEDSVEEPDR
jgi:hypothetical protein